jgi:hypothetical protein
LKEGLNAMETSTEKPFCLRIAAATVSLFALFAGASAQAQDSRFIRGDADGSGTVDISDPVLVLGVLFVGDQPAGCDDASDANDDGRLSVTDPVVLLLFLFQGGRILPDPAGACGVDPSPDLLGCGEFAPCPADVPCLSQETVNGILGNSLETAFCLPADAITLPTDQFTLSVCPAASAAPCGALETPGCPAEITSVSGKLEVENARILIHVEGTIEDLPVLVEESVFGTSATCLIDFDGATADAPFSFDIAVPLVLEEKEPGTFTVTGVGDSTVENVVLNLAATGGLLCTLLQLGQGAVVAPLVALIESALDGVTSQLPDQLTGLDICAGA